MQYVPKYEDKVDYIVKLIKDINELINSFDNSRP